MRKFKILLVDDEDKIREGIRKAINWKAMGVEKVITAPNGIEAWELYQLYKPDLVITDIRMPGMDGIELSKKIYEMSDKVRLIYLSAYSDFDYAMNAIKLGINDYVLKPANVSELTERINSILKEIEKEEYEESVNSHFEKLYKENLIRDVVEGNIKSPDMIKEGMLKFYQFDALGKMAVLVFEIDHYFSDVQTRYAEDLQFMKAHIKTVICNALAVNFKGQNLEAQDKENQIAFVQKVISGEEINFRQRIANVHASINKDLSVNNSITVSAGVSLAGKMEDIADKYKDCRSILGKKFYDGPGILLVSDSPYTFGKTELISDEFKAGESIEHQDLNDLPAYLDSMFQEAIRCEAEPELVRKACYQIRDVWIASINRTKEQFELWFADDLEFLCGNHRYDTYLEYRHWLEAVYSIIVSKMSDPVNYSSVIIEAVKYIQHCYAEDLNVSRVAEKVGITPNYFSHLFKKEMGIAFSEYLNKIRIIAAKKMLKEPLLMGYEVADKVGFQNYHYFTKVFKRMEGVSPSEFKKGISRTKE